MCSLKPICAPPRLSEVSPTLLLGGCSVRLIDDGPLSSFQGRSSSASTFHDSLLQAIDGVMSLALCPQAVSQAPQHFRSSDTQPLVMIALPASLSVGHFSSLRHVQGSKPTAVFAAGCRPLTHASLA